ncbi:MAG: SDR family oxidoreductase [Parachlamydiales bacterium]|jgi:NAD(P)-dependent dehydrogenase (short-subunit alcohol dehydrogenase family)
MDEFRNKVVVITGGNSGIGEAIAQKFDEHGAKIVIFDRADPSKLEAQCKKLKTAIFIQGDVRKIADIEKLYRETEHVFGKIDVLIASAGIAGKKALEEVNEDFFDAIVDTNLKGVYFTVQRSLPSLMDNSSIILISSAACHVGFSDDSVYSSTKAAVSMLARSFAADLVGRKIRVNAISPGYTNTPIFNQLKKAYPQKIQELANTVPLKRFAEPSEVANAALFLASSKSSYIVGVDLVIDGGGSSIYPL